MKRILIILFLFVFFNSYGQDTTLFLHEGSKHEKISKNKGKMTWQTIPGFKLKSSVDGYRLQMGKYHVSIKLLDYNIDYKKKKNIDNPIVYEIFETSRGVKELITVMSSIVNLRFKIKTNLDIVKENDTTLVYYDGDKKIFDMSTKLKSWDALGNPVDVDVSLSGDIITYIINDIGKTYPIIIDPSVIINYDNNQIEDTMGLSANPTKNYGNTVTLSYDNPIKLIWFRAPYLSDTVDAIITANPGFTFQIDTTIFKTSVIFGAGGGTTTDTIYMSENFVLEGTGDGGVVAGFTWDDYNGGAWSRPGAKHAGTDYKTSPADTTINTTGVWSGNGNSVYYNFTNCAKGTAGQDSISGWGNNGYLIMPSSVADRGWESTESGGNEPEITIYYTLISTGGVDPKGIIPKLDGKLINPYDGKLTPLSDP